MFPSGHAAIVTAAALTAVVAVRVVPVARPARLAVVCLTGGYALAIAVAHLVETVHPLTDVLGDTATGLVVTLGGALALTAVSGSERVPSGERCSRSLTRPPHPRCRTQLVGAGAGFDLRPIAFLEHGGNRFISTND